MKSFAVSTFLLAVLVLPQSAARLNSMRSLYRIDPASKESMARNVRATITEGFTAEQLREAGYMDSYMSYPQDAAMSYPLDEGMSYPLDEGMSYPIDDGMSYPIDGGMSYPLDEGMSYPYGGAMSMPICDTTYTCPAECDCNGNVVDGGDICDCYTITSVDPPFDTAATPPTGTWYCFQVDLDKSVEGCGGAKAVSNSILATGFSESCLFHPGGVDNGGSDDWEYETCSNTAATGLKFDFGHSGDADQLSVTYCVDVSCEAAPAGEGSVHWVFKAANDRCDIEVTEGAIPNCGVSSDLCHPSCPDNGGGNGGGGNNGGGNNGNNGNNGNSGNNGVGNADTIIDDTDGQDGNDEEGGDAPNANTADAASVTGDGSNANKNTSILAGSIVGAVAVLAGAGVIYRVVSRKNAAAAADGDAASLSSAETRLA